MLCEASSKRAASKEFAQLNDVLTIQAEEFQKVNIAIFILNMNI